MATRKFFDGTQLLEIDDGQPEANLPVPSHSPDNSIHSIMDEPNADPSVKSTADLLAEVTANGGTVRHAIPVGPPNAGVGVPTPGREDTALNHSLTGGAADDTLIPDPGLPGNRANADADTSDQGNDGTSASGSEFEQAQAGWRNKDDVRASIKAWGGTDPHVSATRDELEEAAKEAFDTKSLA